MRSALPVACAFALLTACTAQEHSPLRVDGAGQPTQSQTIPPRCEPDGYAWQSVKRRTVLVGLSDAEEIRIPAHGWARPPEPRLIRALAAQLSPEAVDAGVRSGDALASLENRTSESLEPIGTHLVLQDPAEHITSKMINDSDTARGGRFVEAVGVRLVTAHFSVTCTGRTGRTVRGTVTTWAKGRSYESLKCGIQEHLPQMAQEAERRACTT
ncbi:hypothetical protein ACFV5G_05855 [Streptomyces sp. NPDC059766]|uniref:hypothetical protein n=1 Tax=Streptomyces sp. NPDC059766 TaxID=3346940 RepID=UPI00365B4532